jgi:hypothetical protein
VSSLPSGGTRATPNEVDGRSTLIALDLLQLQQRFDALDFLYNEEIANLRREFTRLQIDYIRLYQTRASPLPRPGNSSRAKAKCAQQKS